MSLWVRGNCYDPAEARGFEQGYRLGCIVGAAIVAWGDAMRGMLERGAGHADDLAARMIRETHKRLFTDCRCATCWYGKT